MTILLFALLALPAAASPPEDRVPANARLVESVSRGGRQVARFRLKTGAAFHAHSHAHEERIRILSGRVEFGGAGTGEEYGPASELIIPPYSEHWLRAKADSVVEVSRPRVP